MNAIVRDITAQGRGGGKGGGQSNDDNTIRTRARARFIEAISEGPIHGLVNGERSIFFDQTPLMNEDGSYNFKDVKWHSHQGYADEGYFHGHSAVESPFSVEVQVKKSQGGVTRTIVGENLDAVRVIIRIPALVHQTDKGLKKASVAYEIDVRGYQGTWTTVVRNSLNNEKALSPFQIPHRIELPEGGSPWDVRVRRITDDSDDDKLQNDLFWESYMTLTEGKFTYPHTAMVAMDVNAEEMGSSIPPRAFHVKGLLVNVPSNYNPETRAYTGIWNGTFKIAWTNNPAWIFYDLLVNNRYGLGEFVSAEIIDKWSLYTIAQYCDQLVPSGYKNGDTGEMIMEPRFTYNGAINSRDEAFFVLQSITQAWRGMAYWALGKVFATADMPSDPVRLVTPANVIGGDFEYAGTAIKARHSVVMVKWNDPNDFYRPATEIVIDTHLLQKYGWREKSVQLRGCTSRGLAHRYGKWIIDTEQHETETLTYSASWDHTELRPGDIIAVSDPRKAQIRAGGRIVRHVGLQVTLDGDFERNEGQTYDLMLTLPSGKIERRRIASWQDDNICRVETAFSEEALTDALWTITGTDITPRNYRVLTVEEAEPNVFKITALFHDPLKFGRVEQGIVFEPLPYDRNSKTSLPPTDLRVNETGYVSNGQTFNSLTVSWTPPPNFLTRGYVVSVETPNDGRVDLGVTSNAYMEMRNTEAGIYTFRVQTVSYAGILSEPVEVSFNAVGSTGFVLPTVTDLELADDPGSLEFKGADLRVRWKNNFADQLGGAASNQHSPHYTFNLIKIYHGTTGVLLREERVFQESYTYSILANRADCAAHGYRSACRLLRVEVTVSDIFGRTSVPAVKTFNNPVPGAITPTSMINGSTIYMSWIDPTDPDYAGVILHRSETSGINVETATPFYQGRTNALTIPGEYETVYYFRIAAYDEFGTDDLNWSGEFVLTTLSDGADVDPPATPTGLKVTSSLTGNGEALVRAVWSGNTETDLAGYDIEIAPAGGAWLGHVITTPAFEFKSLPGITYKFRVRARDRTANSSAFSAEATHTVVADTTPPALPTNVGIQAGLSSLWLSWKNPADADLDHIEVWENSVDNSATATMLDQVRGTSYTRAGLAAKVKRFYWLRAVDTSGNKSGFTVSINGTTAELPGQVHIQTVGLNFIPNSPSANTVSWAAFEIVTGQAGQASSPRSVVAGSISWSAGSVYIYYVPGETQLRTTANPTAIYSNSGVPLAVYRGGTNIELANGKTVIDGASILTGTVGAQQLVVNDAIITNTLQIADAVISSAKIIDLDAAKIRSDSVLAGSILVGSESLEAIRARAANPAARINASSTLIEPGKVLISGSSSLASWMHGPASTEINGAAIAANTIAGNKAVIGMRGISIDGLTFEHNSPSANRVSWTAGTIGYVGDDGSNQTRTVTASNATWTSGTLYLYWVKDATTISSTTSFATANGANNVILATYRGGVGLFANYGRTIIDGANIKTGTVIADQLRANTVDATQLVANAVRATHIAASQINATHIGAKQIKAEHIESQSITADLIKVGTISADRLILGGVDTTRLAANAATIVAANAMTGGNVANIRGTIVNTSINLDVASAVLITATLRLPGLSGGNENNPDPNLSYEALIVVDGTAHWAESGRTGGNAVTLTYAIWLAAGSHSFSLSTRGGPSGAMNGVWASLAVLGAKR